MSKCGFIAPEVSGCQVSGRIWLLLNVLGNHEQISKNVGVEHGCSLEV